MKQVRIDFKVIDGKNYIKTDDFVRDIHLDAIIHIFESKKYDSVILSGYDEGKCFVIEYGILIDDDGHWFDMKSIEIDYLMDEAKRSLNYDAREHLINRIR